MCTAVLLFMWLGAVLRPRALRRSTKALEAADAQVLLEQRIQNPPLLLRVSKLRQCVRHCVVRKVLQLGLRLSGCRKSGALITQNGCGGGGGGGRRDMHVYMNL